MIVCRPGDDRTAWLRYLRRRESDPMRVYFHGDGGGEEDMPPYEEPKLCVPTLRVNTTEGYAPSIEEIVGWMLKNPCESD